MAELSLEDARAVLAHIPPLTLEAAITRFLATPGEDTPRFVCSMFDNIVEEGRSEEYATVLTEAFLTLVKRTRAH